MQLTAARFVGVQTQRMLDARLPVMREDAFLRIQHTVRDALRQRRPVNIQHVLLPNALIPAAQQEAWIVNVMVKVMVREEQVINLGRMQPRLHQLVSSRRPAVKHQLGAININHIRRPEPCRRASTEDVGVCGMGDPLRPLRRDTLCPQVFTGPNLNQSQAVRGAPYSTLALVPS